jgi:cytochrome bd-type quinol oxidase subunit 1
VIHLLHTFTGVREADPQNTRDWVLTTMWALSMDALAVGLTLMVISSYVMWWRLPNKRRTGMIAVVLGIASCTAIVSAGWLF